MKLYIIQNINKLKFNIFTSLIILRARSSNIVVICEEADY